MDPLPEEKAATSGTTTTTTTPQANEPYKRVYPDWKPTTSSIERGDSELTQDSISKDKDESTTKPEKLRGSYSSTSLSSNTTPLQSIMEEDRRTSQDIPLKINIRRPSEVGEYEPVYQKHTSPVGITSDSHSIYIRPSAKKAATSPERRESNTKCHLLDTDQEHPLSNKIEIDSDNIETPPVVRKNIMSDDKSNLVSSAKKLQAPRPLHQRTIEESLANDSVESKPHDSEVLGDGHFDRHSSARRTRRYRRPTDHSSGNEDRNDSSPESVPTPMFPASNALYSTELEVTIDDDKDDVSPDRGEDPLSKSKSMNILSRIGKHGRNMSSINQEAVREAIRKLKSPTETPERIWSPPREIVVTPKDRIIPSKALNHELNDEGFEETQSCQSLVSDGKDSTSSCNEPAEHSQPHISTSLSPNQPKSKSVVKSLMERNRQSLERSRSLRAASSTVTPHSRTSIIPKRTNSLRRNIDTGAISANKQDVERSGSRTSLRSSRSSLNSSASINTVRNMGLKPSVTQSPSSTRHLSNTSTDKSSLRKKLVQQSSSPTSNSQKTTLKGSNSLNSYLRTPASRSSSSGSSIGGPSSSRQSYTKTSSSNSVTPPISNSPQRPAFRNTVSVSNHSPSPSSVNRSSSRLNNLKGIASKTSNRVSSFMRPTTSSATKVNSSSNRSK